MAPSKLRQAIGAVKDQTSISLAKVGGSSSLSDLEVAIVKATRHEEFPADERHIREILSLTSYSRAHVSACVSTLSRRLSKTKNWVVALKALMLVQRLLAEGDPAYEQEIFFATRRGTRLLNLSDFCDTSKTNSWDYSAFVRTYALYLDERLEYRMQGRRGKRVAFGFEDDEDNRRRPSRSSYGFEEDEEKHHGDERAARATPVQELQIEIIFSKIQHMQQLLERFLACKPTGAAKHHRVIIVALYPILKESFQLYYDIAEILAVLIDRFMELEIPDSVKVQEIFYRTSKQFEELDSFYKWCKDIGIARSSEYPDIEKISQKKLDLMDEFIRDKSALAQCKKNKSQDKGTHEEEEKVQENTEDIKAMKALPAPENVKEEEEEEEEKKEEPKLEEKKEQSKEADLLNLAEDAVSSESHANSLALALFDGLGPATGDSSTTPALTWHAFDDAEDWETSLVQSASNLQGQKPTPGGGFDMLMLDGMYHQAATNQAVAQSGAYGSAHGSASSVAFGSAGRPAMLALPAPPTSSGQATEGTGSIQTDPFAASLVVPPPSYVQMSEMEKKQKFLTEEQVMWQQYARDGMQGQTALDKLHNNYTNNSYHYNNMGGYGRPY